MWCFGITGVQRATCGYSSQKSVFGAGGGEENALLQNLWSSGSAECFLWVNWLLTSEIPVSQMGNWNKACLVRTKAVLLQWIITLANLIIPSGTQHRPNAAWIMEAGSYFQLCSIDFWQVWSYRWLNFSTMIREFSAQELLQFFEVGMEQLFHSEVRLGFSTSFIFIQGKKYDFLFKQSSPWGLAWEKWLMSWVATNCIRLMLEELNCHK